MRFFNRFLLIAVASIISLSSCVESETLSYEEMELQALKAWMEINRPDLLDNYQEHGGYYVEILDPGVADSVAVRNAEGDPWVWFDITCRDLSGNVVLTRDSKQARQQDSYTSHTHYVPYYLFCGETESLSMPEGTYMTLRNKLKIGDNLDFEVRYGTKMRLYLPSSIGVGDKSLGGDGGYEGQFELDANRPMIVEMNVWGHVGNPVAYEDAWVKSFAEMNGGVVIVEPDSEEKSALRRSYMRKKSRADEEKEPVVYDEKWYPAVDTIAGLYINYLYTPEKRLDFDCLGKDTLLYEGQTIYKHGKLFGATSLDEINRQVDEALIKRFGKGLHPADAEPLDSVTQAKVWYVTRHLDGFVVDTNIPEIKKIVYDDTEEDEEGEALTFVVNSSDDSTEANSYVDAWLYAIPQMKLGAWNAILTTSSNAYGATGVSGTSSTSSSSNYADYYNYYNYYNSYYGNSYYNNYYNNYYGYGGYGGYGGYYGNNYYNNYYNSMYYNSLYNNSYYTDTTTTTTITTEVQPYNPLLWQVYIEPAKD